MRPQTIDFVGIREVLQVIQRMITIKSYDVIRGYRKEWTGVKDLLEK